MSKDNEFPGWHGTTIVAVRKGNKVVIAGDGQVSVGNTVMKHNARKVRRLAGGKVIGGFAGATADAFTLFERLESKLEQYPDQLMRAAIELAKAGLLDIISSDYVPFAMLQAAFLLPERAENVTLPTAIGMVTRTPARAVGLTDRGEIAVGKRADLVRVRLIGGTPVVKAVWRQGERVA